MAKTEVTNSIDYEAIQNSFKADTAPRESQQTPETEFIKQETPVNNTKLEESKRPSQIRVKDYKAQKSESLKSS